MPVSSRNTVSSRARSAIKRLVPGWLLRLRRLWRGRAIERRFGKLSRAEVFSKIYSEGMWGVGSGSGSQDEFALPYADFVIAFARQQGIRSIVDIGCGDLRVGKKLIAAGFTYIGVDIVSDLIESHKRDFARPGVTFVCMDATEAVPPGADLCLIRQVLQHLSNSEIAQLLSNCKQYRWILVTEHLPIEEAAVPNLDKPHGPGIRLSRTPRSGVFLEHPPFSLPASNVFEWPFSANEVLRTFLVENSAAAPADCPS